MFSKLHDYIEKNNMASWETIRWTEPSGNQSPLSLGAWMTVAATQHLLSLGSGVGPCWLSAISIMPVQGKPTAKGKCQPWSMKDWQMPSKPLSKRTLQRIHPLQEIPTDGSQVKTGKSTRKEVSASKESSSRIKAEGNWGSLEILSLSWSFLRSYWQHQVWNEKCNTMQFYKIEGE